jgi:23S rRNA pseudouridine2605 synthase
MIEILLFHKPKAVVVSRKDEHRRKTVYDLLPDWVLRDGWLPVGRLDRDSRGLLLFVKDPGLVEILGRPGNLFKSYEVWIRGRISNVQIQAILGGVETSIGSLRCIRAEVLRNIGPKTQLAVILDEGKNRHIRRMFGALMDETKGTPLKVLDLKRTAIGPVHLDVSSGDWRFLSADETNQLLTHLAKPAPKRSDIDKH